jgi:ligand-binding sensor domain-containing protein
MFLPFAAMSATLQKKRQIALRNTISICTSKTFNQWCFLAPLFLLMVSFFSANSSAKHLNNRSLHSIDIIQDNKGFIWLATTNGLIRHDSESSITFNSNNKNWPLPFNWINDIDLIGNDKLLLATETHHLWLFDTNKGTAKALATDVDSSSIHQVLEHQGMYYLNVTNKLYRFNPLSQETQLIATNVEIDNLEHTQKHLYISKSDGVFKVVDDTLELVEAGNITAISAAGSVLLIAKDNAVITLSDNQEKKRILVNNPITSLTLSNDSVSIFTTDFKGNIRQFKLNSLAEIAHNYPTISATFVKKIFHDNTGVLWVLSNRGVEKITPSNAKNIPKIFDVKFNAIALAVHQNNLVLGSYGAGLNSLSELNKFLPKGINNQFSNNGKIITDLYSNGNSLYIATFDGLWQFNSARQTLERVNFPSNNKLLLSMKHKDGALYLATNANGVIKFDIASQRVEYHIQGESLSSSEVIDSLPLANNKLWVATSTGINIVDTKDKSVTKINSFGENKVIALLEYKDKVFVSTKGDGFFIFNLQGELLSHFAKKITFGYMSLINDEIWISGRPGLYRLNPDTYQLNLVANTEQFTFAKKPVLMDNKVYASHYGGVIEVPLIIEGRMHTKTFISKTIVSGKAKLLCDVIDIDSPNDIVTLELASLDFRPGQDKQFKYQINGGYWNDINGSQLTLTGLSSGAYHIEIMGTNSLGQWNDYKAYADINVSYPWYWHPNSQIFYAIICISLIILTLWLLYLRSRSIRSIHKTLNDELSNQSQATSVIRRKLIKIQALVSPNDESLSTTESIFNEKEIPYIQSLIRECLDELSTQSSHAAPSSLSGSSLTVALPYLADYFHRQFHVLVTLHLDVEDQDIRYPLQSAIYRIVYEAILAAISSDNGGVFEVRVNVSNSKIWLKVTSNEQSFAQFNSKINFEMAMYYIRQVANKFNGTFHTYDNQANGSELILAIPLKK